MEPKSSGMFQKVPVVEFGDTSGDISQMDRTGTQESGQTSKSQVLESGNTLDK